ncbi:MAG: HAMP domain-containing sensor histidine kinase [bacterium]
MATIRTRLTVWNGGVLALVLCAFAIAAYGFLGYATRAQVDRALDQQVQLVALTLKAHRDAGSDSAVITAVVRDLESRGINAARRADFPSIIVTSPIRVESDEDERGGPSRRDTNQSNIDWQDLRRKLAALRDEDASFSVRGHRGGVRAVLERLDIGTPRVQLIATQPMHATIELLETARDAELIALPLVLLLALLAGYLLAQRALAPISAMTTEADAIGARNLHERLSVQNPRDELGRLATTFNSVLERVDVAMEQQRRFTADASHELRTPVALIRAEADVALSGEGEHDPEFRAALGVIRDGAVQLSRIVNDLFLLARVDAGQPLLTRNAMYLDELVTTTVQGHRAIASVSGVEFRVQLPGEIPYVGDEELLRRVLRNLLDNAIKYTRQPSIVDVALRSEGSTHCITVADRGIGITIEDQPHIFERFFRSDHVRGHSESAYGAGAGLGLAIAREIAELHGGRLELEHSSPQGSTFALSLPFTT